MDLVENIPEIHQTWKKLENISKQTGLREGLSDGRDSNFQKSFDVGYAEGFKNGFVLGKTKGIKLHQQSYNNQELEKITRGDCIVCQEQSLLETSIKDIKVKQEVIYIKNEEILKKIQ